MKINWGTGIVIAFIGFIGFILYFVVNMVTNDKFNQDLVTEEYYEKELKYQSEIDKINNANALVENVTYEKTDLGLVIRFPGEMNYKNIKGKVFLYRPSNKQLDFETTISLSNSQLLIPDKRLVDGRWNLIVDWMYDNQGYMYKASLVY